MQPDPTNLIERIDLTIPLIGLYDAPDPAPFEPLVTPNENTCVFAYYKSWLQGKTLHLTKDHYGCRGAAWYLCGVQVRSEEDLVEFLFG